MSKDLRIIYIDDDATHRKDLKDYLSDEDVNGFTIKIDCEESFEKAVEHSKQYHLAILDLYKGDPKDDNDMGSDVFEKLKESFFIPIVFYSGNTKNVVSLKSQVVGVATKGDGGVEELKSEIERLTKHNLPFIREKIHLHLEEELRKFFWDIIQKENDKFTPDTDDYSLGYMLLRNFADSLSKDNIKSIVGDDYINHEKVHPMEFYIYPANEITDYTNGDILLRDDEVFVILTPSCDMVKRQNSMKAERILLAETKLIEKSLFFKKYHKAKTENQEDVELSKENLHRFVGSRCGDRFFFLPGTAFIQNRYIDFQYVSLVTPKELTSFTKIAKLDSPYAQSMTSSFIRYYNRIGFPDIDTEYVINHLKI